MELIKKIIMFIISWFKKIFGKKKKNISNNINISEQSKKRYLDKFGINVEESFKESLPSYMIITEEQKIKLLEKAKLIEKRILKTSVENKERELLKIRKLLLNDIKKDQDKEEKEERINRINLLLKNEEINKINIQNLNDLLKDFSEEKKKEVLEIYNKLKDEEERTKLEIKKVDDTIKIIDDHDITIHEENLINKKIDDLINDKNFDEELNDKVETFNNEIMDIIKNMDQDVVDEVMKEYEKLNYITISNVILDKTLLKVKKLEEDYRLHKHNKYYYEREIKRIKEQIENLHRIKDSKEVHDEIMRLRKELYTKSKDKYDLLYNNEILTNIDKKCDDLLDKVNMKVIDIKKIEKVKREKSEDDEKREEQKEEQEKNELLKKILLRFQDLELARRLILLSQKNSIDVSNPDNLYGYLNQSYNEFLQGINDNFNYSRNRSKTELVKLYNDISLLNSTLRSEKNIPIDHINFRMRDLIEASMVEKGELENALEKKYQIPKEAFQGDDLVDEKISRIYQREKELINKNNSHVLRKTPFSTTNNHNN